MGSSTRHVCINAPRPGRKQPQPGSPMRDAIARPPGCLLHIAPVYSLIPLPALCDYVALLAWLIHPAHRVRTARPLDANRARTAHQPLSKTDKPSVSYLPQPARVSSAPCPHCPSFRAARLFPTFEDVRCLKRKKNFFFSHLVLHPANLLVCAVTCCALNSRPASD